MKYETALKSDHFVLVAHGTAEEVAQARDILNTTTRGRLVYTPRNWSTPESSAPSGSIGYSSRTRLRSERALSSQYLGASWRRFNGTVQK